jgi:hypothetical protein
MFSQWPHESIRVQSICRPVSELVLSRKGYRRFIPADNCLKLAVSERSYTQQLAFALLVCLIVELSIEL